MRAIAMRVVVALMVTFGLSACGGDKTTPTPVPLSTPLPPTVPAGLSPVLTQMLNGLQAYITSALAENKALLPLNMQYRAQIQAKIDILQAVALYGEILNGQRWSEGSASSSVGSVVPIATVFMLESMRADAADAIRMVESALPVLEEFLNVKFPAGTVRIWYGFKLGNSGGGGVLYMEDRGTYDGRTSLSRNPYETLLTHELSHSYVPNECLNQFLELYLYNVSRTGSVDAGTWTFTRNWTPGSSGNVCSSAVLDIYVLIGHDAMRDAYRAVYPLRPPYGQPLSQAVIQAFLSAIPLEQQPSVAAKLATITF